MCRFAAAVCRAADGGLTHIAPSRHESEQPRRVTGRGIAPELPIRGVNINDHPLRINPVAKRAPADIAGGVFDIETGIIPFACLRIEGLELLLECENT